MRTLSILIPARNEQFLARTVKDILDNIELDTEIIVGMDGDWCEPSIPDHERVRIIRTGVPIGQRAMTNACCRLSEAKYVMKVDAHCAFDKGFDRKMIEEMEDNWTMVPTMRNLHAFDWVCEEGHRRYQGPSGPCTECGKPTEQDIVWIAKESPKSNSYCFDRNLHFQYFKEWNKRPEGKGDLTESMSIQGSCFLMTRERYWALNICDEAYGSWGQQGVEVACKTWLSGGRVVINQKTWYAHLFRTQGGDFSFPYHNPESAIQKARELSKDIWLNDKWPLAIRKLSWLIEKFKPVPYWHTGFKKGIVFYTDNKLNLKLASRVQRQIRKCANDNNMEIVSASLKPMDNMGTNFHIKMERGWEAYFTQIVTALENSTSDIIWFCEHDVLYHPSHFDFVPPRADKFYYNRSWVKVRVPDLKAVRWDANQVSGLVCYRQLALDFYRERLKEIKEKGFNRSYEPGGRDTSTFEVWFSEQPNVDIRHSGTLTKDKWSLEDFRDKSTAQNFKETECPQWALGMV